MEKDESSIDWKSCSTVTFSMGSAFISFLFWFFNLLLFYRTDMGRKIVRSRIPESAKEVVESADTGSITKTEAAEGCIERINLQLRSQSVREWTLKTRERR